MNNTPLFATIERITALIRSEERRKCAALGIQSVHLQVLDYLEKCNKYSDTPAAVAAYLGMTRGTVSQTVLLLANKGYIKKTPDTTDRRIVRLSLTPIGFAILEQARPTELFNRAKELFLGDGQRTENLDEILLNLLTALQQANRSQSFGLCHSCQFFTRKPDGYKCGLTKEALSVNDSEKICQEHKAA